MDHRKERVKERQAKRELKQIREQSFYSASSTNESSTFPDVYPHHDAGRLKIKP